jgi:hypothetical protein
MQCGAPEAKQITSAKVGGHLVVFASQYSFGETDQRSVWSR